MEERQEQSSGAEFTGTQESLQAFPRIGLTFEGTGLKIWLEDIRGKIHEILQF
jgi:hypothetical protein